MRTAGAGGDSITIAVKGRAPVFACLAVAAAAVDVLRRHAAATGVPVYAWGVMPDHVHLILGASPTCDIAPFVGQFKNLAQREAPRRGIKGAFWQTSFWDHCLRGDERREQVVAYVRNNPVRSGPVEGWCDDRVSGSSVLGLADAGGGQAPALQRKSGETPVPHWGTGGGKAEGERRVSESRERRGGS